MKKKNENKSEKVLKILKIVGSAIGLTLCTAAVVFLMVIGIRGCASSSVRSNDREAQTQERAANYIDEPQNKQVAIGDKVIYNYPFYGDKSNILGGLVTDLHGSSAASTSNGNAIDITYKGETVRATNLSVSVGGGNDLYNVNFYDGNNQRVLSYGSRLISDSDSDGVVLQYVISDHFSFNYYGGDDYNGLPEFRELKLNILYVYPGWSERSYLYTWIDQYFTADDQITEPYNVTFNNIINPFGPMGANFDYFCPSERTGRQVLTTGLFKDQTGTYYKSIVLYYISADGTRFGTPTDYSVYSGGYLRYSTMSYIDLFDREISANAQDFAIATGGSNKGNTVMVKSNHWVSDLFRQLVIYYLDENSNSNNYSSSMTRITALTSLNNISNYTGLNDFGNGSVGSMSLFSLIGSAFSVWAGIFNTQVFPGINLWTLIIIPFLGGIIIFVVWLFKR